MSDVLEIDAGELRYLAMRLRDSYRPTAWMEDLADATLVAVVEVERLRAENATLQGRRCDQCTHWIDDGPESGEEIYCEECTSDGFITPPVDWYCKSWEEVPK